MTVETPRWGVFLHYVEASDLCGKPWKDIV